MIHRIALTPGEPAGVGPDLCVMLAQSQHPHEIVVFADPELLQQRASVLGLILQVRAFNPLQPAKPSLAGELCVSPIKLSSPSTPGILNPANAHYVLECLDQAINACTTDQCQALVTGPVQKSVINDGLKTEVAADSNNTFTKTFFSGHTEYLAQQTRTPKVVMMLATNELRVALVTTHIPLSQVASNITRENLNAVIHILHQSLQTQFGITSPRILVCGLNPHAGEGGHLGQEEIEIIEPTLKELRENGMELIGPLPADTLFTPKILRQGDVVLAMYHDQGLPVLKHQGFGRAVNITLGLPIIRTSVDHGTALDLAGTGKADIGSLETALHWATKMVESSR